MSKNLVLVNFSVDNSIMREPLESKMSHFFLSFRLQLNRNW